MQGNVIALHICEHCVRSWRSQERTQSFARTGPKALCVAKVRAAERSSAAIIVLNLGFSPNLKQREGRASLCPNAVVPSPSEKAQRLMRDKMLDTARARKCSCCSSCC